jgi:lipopolysaccharide biosynthesis glycosyltransferase
LLDIARNKPQALVLHDQSILNLLFHNNWTELSPVWNWMANSKLTLWGDYFGARLIHTVNSQTVWRDVGGRLQRGLTAEYRLYCRDIGIPVPETEENYDLLYKTFVKGLLLQLRFYGRVKRLTARFPTDDVTIRHGGP